MAEMRKRNAVTSLTGALLADHVPKIEGLIADPSLLDSLPKVCLGRLYFGVARLEAELRARLLFDHHSVQSAQSAEPDVVLTIGQAAHRLGTSKDTLYRKWRRLPFAYKDQLDGQVKFSRSGLVRYVSQKVRV